MWWTVLTWAYRVETNKQKRFSIYSECLKKKIFNHEDYLAKLSFRIEEEIKEFSRQARAKGVHQSLIKLVWRLKEKSSKNN